MLKLLQQIYSYSKLLNNTPTDVVADFVKNDKHKYHARKLHTSVYLARGYLTQNDLDAQGNVLVTADPYLHRSLYFSARPQDENNSKIKAYAAARFILAAEDTGFNSFQTIEHISIYPKELKALNRYDPLRCVEVSGLVKHRNTSTFVVMVLYRAMWQYSIKNHHQAWIMSCDKKLFEKLQFLFGDALHRIGDDAYFKGHVVVPLVLDIERSLPVLLAQAKHRNPAVRHLKKKLAKFFVSNLTLIHLDTTNSSKT